MAFPYDNNPPVRDPALPPIASPAPAMTNEQAAALRQQLAQTFPTTNPDGGAVPAPPVPNAGVSNNIPMPPTASTPLNDQQYTQAVVGLTDRGKNNVNGLANEQIGLNNQVADINQAEVVRRQKELEQDAAIKAKADAVAEQHDLEARKMAQDLAAKSIDPDHYWKNQSTGGKILAGIGVALGAIGAGLSKNGTQNVPLQMINQAIASDIDAQKANMEAGWKAYDKLHELDNDAGAKARYNDQWRASHYIAGTEIVKLRLGTIAAKTQNIQVKENALNAIQQLDGKQLDARKALGDQITATARANAAGNAAATKAQKERVDKLSAKAGDDVQSLVEKGMTEEDAQKQVYSRPQNKILADAGLAPQTFQDVAAAKSALKTEALADLSAKKGIMSEEAFAKYQSKVEKEYNSQIKQLDASIKPGASTLDVGGKKTEAANLDRILTVNYNGKTYKAPTKEDAAKFREIADAGAEFKSLVKEEIAAREANKGGTLSRAATGLSDQRRALIIGALGKMGGAGGVLSDKERETFEKLVPNSNDYDLNPMGKDNIMNKLQNLLTIPDAKIGAAFKVHVQNEVNNEPTLPNNQNNPIKIDFTPH